LALTVETFPLLTNPFYTPSCTISATFNCRSVMASPQSEVFGFPNSISQCRRIPRSGHHWRCPAHRGAACWLVLGRLQVGATVARSSWIGRSVFVVGALCPYRMAVWVVTICAFWFVTMQTWFRSCHGCPVLGRRMARFVLRHQSSLLGGGCSR
jgi:uncharacterized membrane protein